MGHFPADSGVPATPTGLSRATSSKEVQASSVENDVPEVEMLLEAFDLEEVEPRTPCFMVDTFVRNREFFGREGHLRSLDDCLLPASDLIVATQPDRTRVALLCGMAGLGKTELAVEYAHSRRDQFDAVFFIRAEDATKLEKDIALIAVRLGIQDPSDPHNTIVNKGLAMGWLTDPFKVVNAHTDTSASVPATWLIVFDNADDPDILLPYKEIADKGAVLITSRNPLAKKGFSSSTITVDLQTFDENDAGKFLQQLTDKKDQDDEAQVIGNRLGGLPLAITQMAGLIRLQFLSFGEFLEMYDEPLEEAEIHEKELQPLRQTARGNISSIWAIEKLSDHARALIEILAFLDPDRIQDTVLSRHGPSIVDLHHYPRMKGAFYKARTELIRSSLVRRNDDTGEFWIHRVVQDAVKAKMTPDHRLKVFSNVVNLISLEWPSASVGSHNVQLWRICEGLYPHIVASQHAYAKYFQREDTDGHISLATLLNRAAW